jgi:hypothetical protein
MVKINLSNIFGRKKEGNVKSLDLVRAETNANDLISNNYISKSETGFVLNNSLIKQDYQNFLTLKNGLDYRISNLDRTLSTPCDLLDMQTELNRYNFN